MALFRITHKRPNARPSLFSRLHSSQQTHTKQPAMELLLLPSRVTAASRPLLPASPLRRARAANFRPAASSSGNVEVTDTTATTTSSGGGVVVKNRQEWRAGGQAPFGLGLDLSDEMRRGMVWRMLALPAAAVAAEAVFLRAVDGAAVDTPAWAGKAGSAVLFAAGLLGSHYGFLSSRWDAAETGSVVGWELAVEHWNAMSMARDSSAEEEDDDEDEDEDEEEYDDDDDDEEYEEEEEEEEDVDD